VQYTPKHKKRTVLLRSLKDVFRRHQSQPVSRVIEFDQPGVARLGELLAVGHSSESLRLEQVFLRDWSRKSCHDYNAAFYRTRSISLGRHSLVKKGSSGL
jgi:hypothetical protein